MQILKELRVGGPEIAAATLARRTGLPRATVHRLLQEMARTGLVERGRAGFRPGVLLFELGQVVPHRRDLLETARRHMLVLNEATGHNVGLAVLDGSEVVHLEIVRGRDAPRLPQRTGGRWPAHASCSGKALLAFSGPAQVERTLCGPLPALTDRTVTDASALRAQLTEARRSGVAFDRRESFANVVGAAAPVRGSEGEVVAALSVSGLAGRISLSRIDAAVRTTALAISRDLAAAASVVRPVLGPLSR